MGDALTAPLLLQSSFCDDRLTEDKTNHKNKQDLLKGEQANMTTLQQQLTELNQEELNARVETAAAARDQAAADLQAAEHGVEAATRELAGDIAGCRWGNCTDK